MITVLPSTASKKSVACPLIQSSNAEKLVASAFVCVLISLSLTMPEKI